MNVTIRYFAALREALGAQEIVDIAPGTTVAALREQLIATSDRHAQALRQGRALRCAVNLALVTDDAAALPEGAEVAFFPPVTGG